MKALWLKLAARFDGLARRERALVAAAAIGGVLLVGNSLLIDPPAARNRVLRQNIERRSGDLTNLQAQAAALEAQAKSDPDAGKKAEIARLQTMTRETDGELAKLESGLVPPERMLLVLETLLRRHPGLRLISFKTLPLAGLLDQPAEPAVDKASGKTDKTLEPVREFNLFRHGIEIQLEGTYADLHSYLVQLEQGPQKFLWGEMRLIVVEHPRSRLTLVLYTVNVDKTWLAI